MNVQFTARHFHASDTLKQNVISRAEELVKFYENITSAHVVLDAEDDLRKKAEVVLNTKGKSITGKSEDEKMGAAIDAAFAKVERQLKKQNEKVKGHKERGLKNTLADIAKTNSQSEEEE
ncbi:MAG: ribosome-associated translation inhibitor RaiA [Fibrobacteres bacterium]|nr:ribosome-associated translation inhibitor RaiA [Fibrobacterota bacterium]